MNSLLCLKSFAVGFALSASALAQAPPAGGPPAPGGLAPAPMSGGSNATISSRIRAYNPGPGGEVRSLYLADGAVVDLSPDLGRSVGAAVRRGERVRVSGLRSSLDGQTVIAAQSLTLDGQAFVAQAGVPPLVGGDRLLPPPPAPGAPPRQAGPQPGPGMASMGPRPGVRGPDRPLPPPPLPPPAPGSRPDSPPPPPPSSDQPAPPPPPPPSPSDGRAVPEPPPPAPNAPSA